MLGICWGLFPALLQADEAYDDGFFGWLSTLIAACNKDVWLRAVCGDS